MLKNIKTKIKDSEAEIEAEIAWDALNEHRQEVLEELRQDFAAPGFRKGKVPMEVFMQNVREDHVLEDAAQRALQEAYPILIEEEKLDTLGRPEITIMKLAAGNSLEFRVKVGVVPEVKLPNYKKIAEDVMKSEATIEVAPEEVEKIIDELRTLRKDKNSPADAPLPELTDEFVKSMGMFENVADFRTKLAENIKMEKENERRRERREKMAEALAEKTKMTLPTNILDTEAENMQERLSADLERAKMSMEDYLGKTKKTKEELLKEHRDYAERQLKTRFILEAIANAEGISADQEEVLAEVNYLRQQHPQTDPETLKRYAENVSRNERVLRFLEGDLILDAKAAE